MLAIELSTLAVVVVVFAVVVLFVASRFSRRTNRPSEPAVAGHDLRNSLWILGSCAASLLQLALIRQSYEDAERGVSGVMWGFFMYSPFWLGIVVVGIVAARRLRRPWMRWAGLIVGLASALLPPLLLTAFEKGWIDVRKLPFF